MIKRTLGCVACCAGGWWRWLIAGSPFPRGRLRHEGGKGAHGDGRESTVCKSPRVADYQVKNPEASTTEWVFTLGSATALAQKQVGKIGPNALHVGDEIKVKCIPAKDGHPLGFLKSITYADGHVIVVSGGGPND